MLERLNAALEKIERKINWMVIVPILAAVFLTVPCAIAGRVWPELKGTHVPPEASAQLHEGRLCFGERCEPGILVTGHLDASFGALLGERIDRAGGKHLWVCLLSPGGESINNRLGQFPDNVSTCVAPARMADGSIKPAQCASACAWVWTAGRTRELFGDAALGFHRSWSTACWLCEPVNWVVGTGTAWWEDMLDSERLGADSAELARKRALRALANTKARNELAWVNAAEAERRGLQVGPLRWAQFEVGPYDPS